MPHADVVRRRRGAVQRDHGRRAGYVLKQIRGTDLIDAIRKVAAGESLLDPAVTKPACSSGRAQEDAGPADASPNQERRILDLIGEGLTNRQIGERMFLAEKTVKNYVSSLLFRKLGMERRTEAAAYAARLDERKRHTTD